MVNGLLSNSSRGLRESNGLQEESLVQGSMSERNGIRKSDEHLGGSTDTGVHGRTWGPWTQWTPVIGVRRPTINSSKSICTVLGAPWTNAPRKYTVWAPDLHCCARTPRAPRPCVLAAVACSWCWAVVRVQSVVYPFYDRPVTSRKTWSYLYSRSYLLLLTIRSPKYFISSRLLTSRFTWSYLFMCLNRMVLKWP